MFRAKIERSGSIQIRVQKQENKLVIEVEDNGVGVGNAGSTSGTGNGIALKNLEERLVLLFRKEGTLAIESIPIGTLVRICIPFLLSPPYSKGESLHVDSSLGEDEAFVRRSIRKGMPWEENGFKVMGECGNGQEALEFIRNKQPDLVICDIMMPVMNGVELLSQVRRENLGTAFIMLHCHE